MEKTVNTAWYAKKCALGTLVCCGTELVLLMLASALILRGAISEEMANGAVLVCTAVAAFLGCMIGARKTSKRAMMTAGCAASAWVTMQVIGFFAFWRRNRLNILLESEEILPVSNAVIASIK